MNNLDFIGGHRTTISGSPQVIATSKGKAIQFDGVDDGLFVNNLPVEGAESFTIEIIFRPDSEGLKEQRFLHLQQDGSDYRILIETRLTDDNKWYLDTYIKNPKGDQTLYDKLKTHPTGSWYNASLVYDGSEMRHYVNGVKEISKRLELSPFDEGKTSISVRLNRVYWFKGAVREIKFTHNVLKPEEFLRP